MTLFEEAKAKMETYRVKKEEAEDARRTADEAEGKFRMEFNALSMFSSAGIAETFFKNHGIKVRVAAEILPERAKIYSHLYPNTQMLCGDITNQNFFNSLMENAKRANCDFIIATPPLSRNM